MLELFTYYAGNVPGQEWRLGDAIADLDRRSSSSSVRTHGHSGLHSSSVMISFSDQPKTSPLGRLADETYISEQIPFFHFVS